MVKKFVLEVCHLACSRTQLFVRIFARSRNHFRFPFSNERTNYFFFRRKHCTCIICISPVYWKSSFPETSSTSEFEPEPCKPGRCLILMVATIERIRGNESARSTVVEEKLVQAERSSLQQMAGQTGLRCKPHHHLRYIWIRIRIG